MATAQRLEGGGARSEPGLRAAQLTPQHASAFPLPHSSLDKPNATAAICHTYLCAPKTPTVVPVFRTFHQPSIPLRNTNVCYKAATLEVSLSVLLPSQTRFLIFLGPKWCFCCVALSGCGDQTHFSGWPMSTGRNHIRSGRDAFG